MNVQFPSYNNYHFLSNLSVTRNYPKTFYDFINYKLLLLLLLLLLPFVYPKLSQKKFNDLINYKLLLLLLSSSFIYPKLS